MKTNLIAVILLSTTSFLVSCNTNASNSDNQLFNVSFFNENNQGKGPITERIFDLSFNQIDVSNSIRTEIVRSNTEKVILSAPDDIIDKIAIETNGNLLYIKVKNGVQNISTNRIKVIVYAKNINSLQASSSASILIKDTFKTSDLEIKTSSSASIKGDFEATNLKIKSSSSGDYNGNINTDLLDIENSSSGQIILSGNTKNATVKSSSSGSVSAANLITQNANLSVSSSAHIKMGVTNELYARASSSGSIAVIKKGQLKIVDIKESSSGSVTVN